MTGRQDIDCIIKSSNFIELSSPVPGQLDTVLVDRSDTVADEQMVATLDSRLEKANLAIARFKATSNTELSLRKAAYEIDHRAETALDRRRICSPIDVVVVARLRNPGEYIEDQPLLRIVKLDPLHVEAILPMRLFGKIRPGMLASVTPEHDEIANLTATVELVDPMGDAASGTFGVRLKLPNPDRTIPAGLKCSVEIKSASPVLSSNRAANYDSPRFAAADRDQKSLN